MEPVEMHGLLFDPEWEPPVLSLRCDQEARPGYQSVKAHEYCETPQTLQAKISVLAQLIRRSKQCVCYTGAGLSTASGIGDYATHVDKPDQKKLRSPIDAQPTYSHYALTAIYKAGFLKHWIQQNHDGLPQKAGFPQWELNEIHGAWYDPANPVILMSGQLRTDLFNDMLEWEEKCDLCLTLGTSLAGMNADRMASTPAGKAVKQFRSGKRDNVLGTVIVGLQQTQLDKISSLRIFSKIDDVMRLLAEEMKLDVPTDPYQLHIEPQLTPQEDIFMVPFNEEGIPCNGRNILDLREGKKVKLTGGMFEGDVGIVTGKSLEGHFKIRFKHIINPGKKIRGPLTRMLGVWWIESAVKGHGVIPGGRIPVVSVPDDIQLEYELDD